MTFKVGENIMNDDVKETKANQDEIENESGYFHDLDSFEEKTDLAPAKRRRVTLLNMTTVLLVLFVCASICVFLFNCVSVCFCFTLMFLFMIFSGFALLSLFNILR